MRSVFSALFSKKRLNSLILRLSVIGFVFMFTFVTAFQNQEKQPVYYEVRIYISTQEHVIQLAQQGLILPEAKFEKSSVVTVLNESDMEILKKSGFAYEVIVEDLVAEFNNRPTLSKGELLVLERQMKDKFDIEGFGYGSMAGFYTWPEINSKLDSMHLQYPSLTLAKDSIGCTLQNRPIYAIKISANPAVNDPNKPEVLYTAMLHAREPQAMMCLMYYMYYMLENYGTNDEVTYLLDHRQLWFIPCCNPDGYEYNRQTNPSGGGMWRKNRWIGANGTTYGVDLNRNFGYMWGYDNNGSDPDSNDDTFRGRTAFSELETQAVKNFTNNHHFRAALNYHTYSSILIYPWGYIDALTPDSARFTYYARTMTQFNNYDYGNSSQLLYAVNGSSDDWMYGDITSERPRIFAMTPEVGTTGFWPSQSEIFPLAQENLFPNLYLSKIAGPYAEIIDTFFNQPAYLPGDSGIYSVYLQNIGVSDDANYEYRFLSESPYITVQNDTGAWAMTGFQQVDSSRIRFYISETVPAGINPVCTLKLYQEGVLQKSFSVTVRMNQAAISSSLSDTLRFEIIQTSGDSVDEDYFYLRNAGPGTLNYSISGVTLLERLCTERKNGLQAAAPASEETKGEVSGGNGSAVTEGSGGPDLYGYKWKDSDAPGGPVYSFIDISSTGTQISFSSMDDAYTTVPLPFPVKYYGTTYSGNITVSTNGWVGFGSYTSNYLSNAAIPNSNAPNNIIALLWDDLHGSNAGSKVYYGTVGNKFIIQFKNWNFYKSGGNSGGDLNFEVILTQNSDKVEIQYATMNPGTLAFTSNSIGIENSSGTIGLQCAYNASYIHSNMAIRFSRLPEWISVTPSSGTISPNDSAMITVRASSSGFEDFGVYQGSVSVQNNDLFHNPFVIPAVLRYQNAVGTGDPSSDRISSFNLSQNYPNPFNPSTVIRYQLAGNSKVSLKIYNLLGQEVRTLINTFQNAGEHSVIWDGRNHLGHAASSGIYIYRLKAGSFMQSRKMLLVR